jgi:segregation and condensation protein A
MPFELKLDKFSGPLEKLLELMEERKLAINEVSLAQVTDDFLKYLASLQSRINAEIGSGVVEQQGTGSDYLRIIADFIVVASRLILIKSKYLLPDLALTGEEEADIKDLEYRLRLYQELKPAMKVLQGLWQKKNTEFSRPYFLARGFSPDAAQTGIFYPGNELSIEMLTGALQNVFESIQTYQLETKTIREKIVTIEEKMQEIITRLGFEKETNFARLSGSKSRTEIILIFLAVLHLAREQLIFLEQAGQFSEITIKKSEPSYGT